MAVILTTARLRLEPVTTGDVDALHQLWTDTQVRRYLWDDVVIARDQAAGVVVESLDTFVRRSFGQWKVLPPAGGELIGFCGLREVSGTGDVELLYGFAPECWGQGLATEASRAVLRHAFDTCGLERVIARTDEPNFASQRLMERLHMEREPPEADGLVRCSITREAFARG